MASDRARRTMTLQAFLDGAVAHGANVITRRLSEELERTALLADISGEAALFYRASLTPEELASILEYTEMTEMYRSRNAVGHIAASEAADRYWFWLQQEGANSGEGGASSGE